jgi:maltooligosyltrehalose trehalohydrolase
MIAVWAPRASRVELAIGDRLHPMTRTEGWWSAPIDLPAGTDYGFVLDGAAPLPDPRSPFQPHGVHGRSRAVDHGAYRWRDGGFQPRPLAEAVMYEMHVGTFSPEGTFDGAIERLDHLTDLGVTHVEVMPVAQFPGVRGWGYDGVDLYAVHHGYGGPEGLKRFVDACHRRGLAVLLDVVYNHLGPNGNYLERFGPYFTDRYRTPWGAAVNLDGPGSDEVRRYICDSALMWLRDYHVDGLRLDAVHALIDTSAVHLLEQLAGEVADLSARLGRRLLLVAESDLNDPRVIRPVSQGGYGLDAQWNDDFHHALHTVLTGEQSGYYVDFGTIGDLARAFTQAFVYDGRYSRFRQRRHGRPPLGLGGDRFVVFLQNHDQVGNRARGERMSHLVSPDRLAVAAALVMTAPFVPMLFQGEEWGASTPFQYFVDHDDAELAAAIRRGRQAEFAAFGWRGEDIPDPQARETFERSKLDWEERHRAPHARLLDWHRRLIAFRRAMGGARQDGVEPVAVRYDETARWLVVERERLVTACNLSGRRLGVPLGAAAGAALRLASSPEVEHAGAEVLLPPDTVAVLERAPVERGPAAAGARARRADVASRRRG